MSKNWRICTKRIRFMPFFLVNLNKSFLVNHLTFSKSDCKKLKKNDQVLTENHLLLVFQKKCPRKCVKRVCQTFPERLVVRNIMKVFFIHKEAGSMNEGKSMLSS